MHSYASSERRAASRMLNLPDGLKEQGKVWIANFGRTKFGCRIYELAEHGAGADAK